MWWVVWMVYLLSFEESWFPDTWMVYWTPSPRHESVWIWQWDSRLHLRPLRVDGEGRHDEVRSLRHQLAYQPRPLLETGVSRQCSDLSNVAPDLLPRVVVPLQVAVVTPEADVEAVGEVAGLAELLQQVHAVSAAAEAVSDPPGSIHVLRTLHPALPLAPLLAGHPEGLVPDVDEGPLHNGQHLEMSGNHDPTWLVSGNEKIIWSVHKINETSTLIRLARQSCHHWLKEPFWWCPEKW